MSDSTTIKVGETITAKVLGKLVTGRVTGSGTHKGRQVVDVIDTNGNGRFFYVSQINR